MPVVEFGQGGYKASGGLHGVGASVVNALSDWLTGLGVLRDGTLYKQSFKNGGEPVGTVKKKNKPSWFWNFSYFLIK